MDADKKTPKKSVHFWVSAEVWSAWYISLSEGTEKTAELLNIVVFIRGFQCTEPPQQLFTSLPISPKHILPVSYGRNFEVNFSSGGGTGGAWGREAPVPFSAFPKNSGDKAGMGFLRSFTVLPNPIETLKNGKVLRNTEPLSAPHRRKGGHTLICLGDLCLFCSLDHLPALLSPGVGRHRAITNRNLKALLSGIWSGNQLCQILSKYLYPMILHTTWKQVILLWLQ